AHLEDAPARASKKRHGLPETIDAVIGRALAKEPEQRYPSCGTLIVAAEHALGLAKTRRLPRRRLLLFAALIVVGGLLAAISVPRGHGRAAAPLFARPNSLARIDPATNRVVAVIDVGLDPVVVAAAGRSVWVYNEGGSGTISE